MLQLTREWLYSKLENENYCIMQTLTLGRLLGIEEEIVYYKALGYILFKTIVLKGYKSLCYNPGNLSSRRTKRQCNIWFCIG